MENWAIDRYRTRDRSYNDYFSIALDPAMVTHVVDWVAAKILAEAPTAQAIAFRGFSGAMVAPIVAYKLGLNPIGIRKPNEGSHGGSTKSRLTLEGHRVERYVIVDDFVLSGDTVRKIIGDELTRGMTVLGVFCYSWEESRSSPQTRGLAVKLPCWGVVPDTIYRRLET